jgi:predicted AAA+ superfamily ATPase
LKFKKGLFSRRAFIEEYRSATKGKKVADDLGELFETLTKEYDSKTLKVLEAIPNIKSLRELFDWSAPDFYRISEIPSSFIRYFHEYLFRGGFPQTIEIDSIEQVQKLLREDIIDKVLKRDMTAIFKTRNVLELEHVFLYLCLHGGGLVDLQAICQNLEVERPTVERFIQLFEATHLAYRLQRFGYGKEVLRAKYKIYLADPAISAAVLLRGKSVLDDPHALGVATETAVFKHLISRYYSQTVRFSYWQNKKKEEVDLIAEIGDKIIPFEVKYRAQHTGVRELKGLLEFCHEKNIERAYVVTKSLDDFGVMENTGLEKTKIMRIPASLMCYWMGQSEGLGENIWD